jgi:hypothetical protein
MPERVTKRGSQHILRKVAPLRQCRSFRSSGKLEAVASAAVTEKETEEFTWKGSDEFTSLGDR